MVTKDDAVIREFEELEARYWRAHENGLVDECMALASDPFLGCDSSGTPLTRKGLEEKVRKTGDEIRAGDRVARQPDIDFQHPPVVVGDVAVILLTRHQGKRLITHTWVRNDGRWLLLGGMSQHRE